MEVGIEEAFLKAADSEPGWGDLEDFDLASPWPPWELRAEFHVLRFGDFSEVSGRGVTSYGTSRGRKRGK